MKPYKLEGDPQSLDDIRRDIATLRELEMKALQAQLALVDPKDAHSIRAAIAVLQGLLPPSATVATAEVDFNQVIRRREFMTFAQDKCHKSVATRAWNCLTGAIAGARSAEWLYLGDFACKSKAQLERVPNLGDKGIKLIGQLLQSRGTDIGMANFWTRPEHPPKE